MRKPSQLNSRSQIKSSDRSKKVQVHKRAMVEGKVFIHDEEHLFIAPLNNISAGGIFIDQLIAIPEGSEVRVVVKSPGLNEAIQVSGKVVRVEQGSRKGMAIQFEEVSTRAKEIIEICVAEKRMQNVLKAA